LNPENSHNPWPEVGFQVNTAATLLIEAGVPVKAVSERLGHSNVAITLGVYVHSTPAQHDQAAAVLGALVE